MEDCGLRARLPGGHSDRDQYFEQPRIAAILPQSINSILSWFGGIGASVGLDAKILVFAGVAGGALQTWLTSVSATSLADRNALVYARMVETLDELAKGKFDAARAFASRGDMRPVEDFWRDLSFALMAEQEGWSDADCADFDAGQAQPDPGGCSRGSNVTNREILLNDEEAPTT